MNQRRNRNIRARRRHGRRGYILIVTLFIIAMVGILTVGLARHSMNMAISAVNSESDLQTRWGTASCQRFAIENQQELLSEQIWNEQTNSWVAHPVARSTCEFNFGKQLYLVRLDDESSKLSLNHAIANGSRQKVTGLVRKFARNNLAVALRPLDDTKSRGPTEQPFESWGQVFTSTGSTAISPDLIRDGSEELTCWSRQLNFATASDEVLYEATKLLVGGSIARQITDLREKQPELNLEATLRQTNATEVQVGDLRNLLTNRSRTQSVWVTANSPTSTRDTLTIREEFTDTLSRLHSFTW